ncbi:MAG: hypothetical protein IKU36_02205 [Bacteroidales bacterium]|nr:hypothetical protein [Bacteroidales bacterium]
MSKQDFVFTVDAHHFQVTSRRHHNTLYTPCAYIRPSTSNGKADVDKVLIFFEKSVANEFNRWIPGFLKQSQTTGRWYTVLRTENIDCTNMGHFDHVKSFIRKAAEKSNDMDSDFPIKHLYFHAVVRDFAVVPKLREIKECDGAFGDAVYFRFHKEEPEEMGKKDKTVLDVWKSFTDDQKNIVYFMIGKALEDKGINIPLPAPQKASIHKIVFNGPATIVFWTDGTKTIVRYNDKTETIDDREKAVFAACAKKILGTNATGSNYLDRIKPAFDEAQEEWAKRIVKEEADNA